MKKKLFSKTIKANKKKLSERQQIIKFVDEFYKKYGKAMSKLAKN